jgi:hypothetical protein
MHFKLSNMESSCMVYLVVAALTTHLFAIIRLAGKNYASKYDAGLEYPGC